MLSEEEKKILKIFKAQVEKEETEYFSVNAYTQLLYDSHKTVLNLITKLQKENEHQTEKINNQKCELAVLNEKQKDMNKLINDVKSYKGQFKRQEKQIRELQKENEEKDNIINLMTGYIATLDIEEDICSKIENEHCDKMNFGECEDCIKQYFAGLVEKE